MISLSQSPTDPGFVQDPYPFYARARAAGDLFFWRDYGMVCATSDAAVRALLRARNMGRECPSELAAPVPAHLAPFYALEAHSMLELEPPRHTRLRGLVTRAFTSRAIAALAPGITTLTDDLIADFPDGEPFDLLPALATPLPVITICTLLGVPVSMAGQLLDWSHAMVAMYQARRDHAVERAAARAAGEFAAFMRAHIEARRGQPRDDLLTALIAAEEDGARLSTDELVTTCILLLNAGHEATVHSLANAVKTLLEHGLTAPPPGPEMVEECLRFDPPLHMFTRYSYEDFTAFGHDFRRGDQVALLLACANRDEKAWPGAGQFDPARFARHPASSAADGRPVPSHHAFGGGIHFCVGAPLARLELQIALSRLFARCPGLRLAAPPRYADSYHFRGLTGLMVTTG